MNPVNFEIANTRYGPSEGMTEGQVQTIHAYKAEIPGPHPLEGAKIVVVAWKPTREDLDLLLHGGLVYISMVGGFAPHFLTTKIEEACYRS